MPDNFDEHLCKELDRLSTLCPELLILLLSFLLENEPDDL